MEYVKLGLIGFGVYLGLIAAILAFFAGATCTGNKRDAQLEARK